MAEKEKNEPAMKGQRVGQYEEVLAGPSGKPHPTVEPTPMEEDREDREETLTPEFAPSRQTKPRVPRQKKLSKLLKKMTDPYHVAEFDAAEDN